MKDPLERLTKQKQTNKYLLPEAFHVCSRNTVAVTQ